ncbi:MAG: hypothetical protein ACOCYW_02675 [Roseicyclus sp.]
MIRSNGDRDSPKLWRKRDGPLHRALAAHVEDRVRDQVGAFVLFGDPQAALTVGRDAFHVGWQG